METLFRITHFIIFGVILAFPILIFVIIRKDKRLKRKFIPYIIICLFLLGILILLFSWWTHKSDMILLSQFGYDYDALSDVERFKNVAQENIENVKRLKTSIMGIGWPLKAIFGFVMWIPYPFIVYLGLIIIDKIFRENKKNEA